MLNLYVASAKERSVFTCNKTTEGLICCNVSCAKSRDQSTSDVPAKFLIVCAILACSSSVYPGWDYMMVQRFLERVV